MKVLRNISSNHKGPPAKIDGDNDKHLDSNFFLTAESLQRLAERTNTALYLKKAISCCDED